jgi:hypothetical protein
MFGTTERQSDTSSTMPRLSARGLSIAATVSILARSVAVSEGDAAKIRSFCT